MTVIRIITMVGGADILGEVRTPLSETGFVSVKHPYRMQMAPGNNCNVVAMLNCSLIFDGDSILINMASVMWIIEPTKKLRDSYLAARGGILLPNKDLMLNA